MGLRWRGVLLVEGVETGDHRMIEVGATRWRTLPLDFRAVFEDGWGAHEGATPVAIIETIEMRDGGVVWGDGPLLLGDECADRWANLNIQGALRGVSVDLTGGTARIEIVHAETGEVLPEEVGIDVLWGPEGDSFYVREVWSDAEIGAATAVGTPAFAEATVEVYDDAAAPAPAAPAADAAPEAVAASAFASIDDVEVGDTVEWTEDDETRTGTITAVNTDTNDVTVETGDGESVTMPVADVTITTDGADDVDPDGDAASRFPALQAQVAPPAPRPALAGLLARERGDVVTASAMRGEGAVVVPAIAWNDGPPRSAFERTATGPSPWTVEDDGTCWGHLALWGQCHTGFAGAVLERCLMPASSPSNYALFHASGQVRCSDGSRLEVGIISMDTGHAPSGVAGRRPSARVVRSHYDNTGTQAMQIRVVDDEWGPFACGVIAPGVSVDDVRRAMAAKPSGDWRNYGSGLDLLGVLMVNVPGYPVYEVDDGSVTMLVASLSPPADFTARPPVEHPHGTVLNTTMTWAAGTPVAKIEADLAALRSTDCGCAGTCGSCGTNADAAAAANAEPIRFPALALRAMDAAMS